MNQLEQWHENGVILIIESEVVQKEAMVGNNPLRVGKALGYVYTYTLAGSEEQKQLFEIASIIFPKGIINSNQINDVEIVFNALKYIAILLTNDGASKSQPGGILGHRAELKKKFGITIMTDKEAVEYVRSLINKRDQRARNMCKQTGEPLPEWVGKD